MPRGFLAGVVSGGLVGALGLAGLSLVLPPPGPGPAAPGPAAAGSAPPPAASAVPAASDTAPARPSGEVPGSPPERAVTPAAPAGPAAAPPDAQSATPRPAAPGAEKTGPAATPPAGPAQSGGSAAPAPAGKPPAPAATAPAPAAKPPAPSAAPVPAPSAGPAPSATATAPVAPVKPGESSPAATTASPPEVRRITPPAAPDAPAEGSAPVAADRPALIPVLPPQAPGAMGNTPASGSTGNRVPQAAAPGSTASPAVAGAPALERFARAFDNPTGRPPFAVLLLDEGAVPTAELTALAESAMPLTLVMDPSVPEAAQRAALWRSAGQEVAVLARDLPEAGTAQQAESSLEAITAAVPAALALVMPSEEAAVQRDRAAAEALIPALRTRGIGLVSWDQGVNAGDQVARRGGLPAARIYRDLSGSDEGGPLITRALDRAAFKAQQDGRAVVLGRLDPATLEAVLSWSLSARAASLAPAPLSATLK